MIHALTRGSQRVYKAVKQLEIQSVVPQRHLASYRKNDRKENQQRNSPQNPNYHSRFITSASHIRTRRVGTSKDLTQPNINEEDNKSGGGRYFFLGVSAALLAAAAAAAQKKVKAEEVKGGIDFGELEAGVDNEKERKRACIICVGSTGTGKSTLIKVMTGRDVESNPGADSVTTKSSVYKKKKQFGPMNQLWVDTQGWEDSDIDKQDNQIFRDIFQCLVDENMTHISGIIWNINPNERATDTLQRQARLIQRFGNLDESIWSRVLIVCKKMQEPDLPFQGAKKAISMAQAMDIESQNVDTKMVPLLGFTIYEDPHIQKKVNKYKTRHRAKCPQSNNVYSQHTSFDDRTEIHFLETEEFCQMCLVAENSFEQCTSEMCVANRLNLSEDLYVMTDDEIRKEVTLKLDRFQQIQIKYRKQKCLACGVVTDARLMPYTCHTTSRRSHGQIHSRHTEPGSSFHTGQQPPYHSEDGMPCFSGTKFACCGKTERSFWNDKLLKNSGCKNVWSCCERPLGSEGCSQVLKHDCCQASSKSHKLAAVKRHIPVTEFPYPGWGFNPYNWDLGGCWAVQYGHVCGHPVGTPGCRDYFPCCHRMEREDEGGCQLEDSPGCEDFCIWCDERPGLRPEGCRLICCTCGGEWGKVHGCTVLPELRNHDVRDFKE